MPSIATRITAKHIKTRYNPPTLPREAGHASADYDRNRYADYGHKKRASTGALEDLRQYS